jgi:protein-S-isoprenylcysteine O-methyltransferase Ste14
VLSVIRALAWLACALYSIIPGYWLLIHPHADYWRSHRAPYKVLLPVWASMFVLVLGSTVHIRKVTLYDTPWSWVPAAGLFAFGIWLYKTGGADFNLQQLQGVPELSRQHAIHPLVVTGIRARVRHPIYLAHFSEMLAWTIGSGLVVCAALTAIAIVGGIFLIRTEDKELERRFGEPYRAYRKSVPAIVPRLGRSEVRL